MNRVSISLLVVIATFTVFGGQFPYLLAAEPDIIVLPQIDMNTSKPLMQVLKLRQSSRDFSSKALPRQTLANLLWAAYGVNRPEEGKRTAPSAHNRQEIDVYIALSDGLYLYDAFQHAMQPISREGYTPFDRKAGIPGLCAVKPDLCCGLCSHERCAAGCRH